MEEAEYVEPLATAHRMFFERLVVPHAGDGRAGAEVGARVLESVVEPENWRDLDALHSMAAQRRGRFGRGRPLLVGEAPGPRSRSEFPLYPLPSNSSGGRLCAALGMSTTTYLRAFDRVDLITEYPGEAWGVEARFAARVVADAIKQLCRGRLIFMMGARVSEAFGHGDLDNFGTHDDPVFRYRAIRIPHPSGRNRYWRLPGAGERVRDAFRKQAPWLFTDGGQ